MPDIDVITSATNSGVWIAAIISMFGTCVTSLALVIRVLWKKCETLDTENTQIQERERETAISSTETLNDALHILTTINEKATSIKDHQDNSKIEQLKTQHAIDGILAKVETLTADIRNHLIK